MTLNHCKDMLRSRRRRPEIPLEPADRDHKAYEPPSPESAARTLEAKQLLEAVLNDLSPEYREVLMLREATGLSYVEIAETMKCSVESVRARIRRAREAAREMARHFGTPSGVQQGGKDN